jgi:RES domain-containing protein
MTEARPLIHAPELLDRLSGFAVELFQGRVYRATRQSLDPLAYSTRGGRWAPPNQMAVLYTSLEADGAMAEASFHLSKFTPRPSKPVALHTIDATAEHTLRLIRADLETLGVEASRYEEPNYRRTQEIGAAVAFLGNDGLIVPSARWDCDNLVLFNDNCTLVTRLDVVGTESRDWQEWCRAHGRWDL